MCIRDRKEQIIFPEINYDRIDQVRGMDVIVTTSARTDEEAREPVSYTHLDVYKRQAR